MKSVIIILAAVSLSSTANVEYKPVVQYMTSPQYHRGYSEDVPHQQVYDDQQNDNQYAEEERMRYIQPRTMINSNYDNEYNSQDEANEYIAQHQANPGHGNLQPLKILESESHQDDHSYRYAYRTENGIQAQEIGQTKDGHTVEGSYSYVGDDGKTYTVTYVADEHGYRATGEHLPTPPPIPLAIYESLEKNAQDEARGIHDDGEYHEQHPQGQQQYAEEMYLQPESNQDQSSFYNHQ